MVGYPEPLRTELRHELREYTVFLVDKVWPAQQTGQLLDQPTAMFTAMHGRLLSYHPPDSGASIMHAEAMRKFDDLVDLRRQRVDRVDDGLPGVLWVVVGIGALVTLVARFFIWVDNVRVHALMLTLLAVFVGLLVYLIRRVGPAISRHGERFLAGLPPHHPTGHGPARLRSPCRAMNPANAPTPVYAHRAGVLNLGSWIFLDS